MQKRWKSGDLDLVVATKAFGMGVNKADVQYTLHAQMPGSMEAFYQEAGRAGRDGKDSQCKLLFKKDPELSQSDLASVISYPSPSKIQKIISSANRQTQGDVRSQFYFLNQQNIETAHDTKLMMQLLKLLPNAEEEKIIAKEDAKLALSGHHLQIALYRLHQLGVIKYWTVLDWGFGDAGVETVVVKCRTLADSDRFLPKLVESIDGTNSERYQQAMSWVPHLKTRDQIMMAGKR